MLVMCTDTTCEFCDGMDCNNPEPHIHIQPERLPGQEDLNSKWSGDNKTWPVCKSHKSEIYEDINEV